MDLGGFGRASPLGELVAEVLAAPGAGAISNPDAADSVGGRIASASPFCAAPPSAAGVGLSGCTAQARHSVPVSPCASTGFVLPVSRRGSGLTSSMSEALLA
jgi:hypothetical protein